MKKTILLLTLSLPALLFSQEFTGIFTGKCNIQQSGSGAGYWQVGVSNFSDPRGVYDAMEIDTNDILYFNDGGVSFALPVTAIISAAGNAATIRVSNVGVTTISSVPTATAFISRGTTLGIHPWVSNIPANDNQMQNEHNEYVIDSLIGLGIQDAVGVPLAPPIDFGGVNTTDVQAALTAIDARLDTAINAQPAAQIAYGASDSSGLTSNYAFRYNGGGNLAITTQDTSVSTYKTLLPWIFLRNYLADPVKRSDDIVRIGGSYTGNGTTEKGTFRVGVSEVAGSWNHYLEFDHNGKLGINTFYLDQTTGGYNGIDSILAQLHINQKNSAYWYSKYFDTTGAFKFGVDSVGNLITKQFIYMDNTKGIIWKNAAGSYMSVAGIRMDGGNTLALRSGGITTGGIKFEVNAGTVGWRMMDDATFNFDMVGAGNIAMRGGWLNNDGVDGDGVFVTATGMVGIQQGTPTAHLHIPVNTSTNAGMAAMKFDLTGAVLMTVPEDGGWEPVGDDIYYTIPTGTARKKIMFSDIALTSGRVPVSTTNGRQTDFSTFTYNTTNGLAVSGTTTNDNAAAGNVSEYVPSSVTDAGAISMTTATPINIDTLVLTAGDWDVDANLNFIEGASTVTARAAAITTTSATLPSDGTKCSMDIPTVVSTGTVTITLKTTRISIASTTNVYLVASATFSAGSEKGGGSFSARRVR